MHRCMNNIGRYLKFKRQKTSLSGCSYLIFKITFDLYSINKCLAFKRRNYYGTCQINIQIIISIRPKPLNLE